MYKPGRRERKRAKCCDSNLKSGAREHVQGLATLIALRLRDAAPVVVRVVRRATLHRDSARGCTGTATDCGRPPTSLADSRPEPSASHAPINACAAERAKAGAAGANP